MRRKTNTKHKIRALLLILIMAAVIAIVLTLATMANTCIERSDQTIARVDRIWEKYHK